MIQSMKKPQNPIKMHLDDQESELLRKRYHIPGDDIKCAGGNCTKSRNKNKDISFFRFPKDLENW